MRLTWKESLKSMLYMVLIITFVNLVRLWGLRSPLPSLALEIEVLEWRFMSAVAVFSVASALLLVRVERLWKERNAMKREIEQLQKRIIEARESSSAD